MHAGANLSDADKAKLKKLNEEESNAVERLHHEAAGRDQGRRATSRTDKAALAGLERRADRGRRASREGRKSTAT